MTRKFIIILFLWFSILALYFKDINVVKKNLLTGNVIISFDGYYYARIARTLTNEKFTVIDYLKNVPDYGVFPQPVPMLSYIAYLLNKFLGIDFNLLLVVLPPLLASLFIFTMYLYFKEFLPFPAFLSGAILGVLNSIYAGRNTPGRFDTDSLILFFVFLILFILNRILLNLKDSFRKSLIWFSIFIGTFYLFMWWYQKHMFSLFFLISLILGFIAFYFKEIKNKRILKNFFTLFILYIVSLYPFLSGTINSALSYAIRYFFKMPSNEFLPESLTKYVSELQAASIKTLNAVTFDNCILLTICSIGFILILYRHFKFMAVSTPIILIGILSFGSGVRFLIYLIPFLSLGIGYIFYISFNKLKTIKSLQFLKKNIYYYLMLCIIVLVAFPTSIALVKPRKAISDEVYTSLLEAKKYIKENAFIWSTWNLGNVYQYVLERGTYLDNGNWNFIKYYSVSNSFYTDSKDRAYKLISFITNHYYYQYKELSFEDFNKKVDSYNKKPIHDVYIVFNRSLPFEVQTTRLGVYGTNIKEFEIPMIKNITECKSLNSGFFDCGIFTINVKNHMFIWNYLEKNDLPNVNKIIFIDRENNKQIELSNYLLNTDKKDIILEISFMRSKNKLYFSFIIPVFYETILNKLFIKGEKLKYFKKVYDNFPYLTVYKVEK